MNFDMTYNEAIQIQDEQIEFYGKHVPGGEPALRELVKSKTKPCPEEGGDHKFDIFMINEMVPRGAAIEYMVTEMTDGRIRFGDF